MSNKNRYLQRWHNCFRNRERSSLDTQATDGLRSKIRPNAHKAIAIIGCRLQGIACRPAHGSLGGLPAHKQQTDHWSRPTPGCSSERGRSHVSTASVIVGSKSAYCLNGSVGGATVVENNST